MEVQVHGNLNLSILSEACSQWITYHDAMNTIDAVLLHSEEDCSTYLHRCSFNDQRPFRS